MTHAIENIVYLIYGVTTLIFAFYIPHRILAVELNKNIINKKRDIFVLAASIVLFTGPISSLIIDSYFGYGGIQEFINFGFDFYFFYGVLLPVLIGLLLLACVYLYFWKNFKPAKYYLMWYSIWSSSAARTKDGRRPCNPRPATVASGAGRVESADRRPAE